MIGRERVTVGTRSFIYYLAAGFSVGLPTRKSIFAKGIKTSYNRGMGKQKIVEYFEEVEASREYSGSGGSVCQKMILQISEQR